MESELLLHALLELELPSSYFFQDLLLGAQLFMQDSFVFQDPLLLVYLFFGISEVDHEDVMIELVGQVLVVVLKSV